VGYRNIEYLFELLSTDKAENILLRSQLFRATGCCAFSEIRGLCTYKGSRTIESLRTFVGNLIQDECLKAENQTPNPGIYAKELKNSVDGL
jgi:hypothetical protein